MKSDSGGPRVAVILGAHPFPHGNASANRMLSLAQTFAVAEGSALVINDNPLHTQGERRESDEVRGIRYINLAGCGGGWRARADRRRTFAARVVSEAKTVAGERISVVVVPSVFWTPSLNRRLRQSLPSATVVVDVVERHDRAQFSGRGLSYFVRHRLTSWYAAKRAPRLLAISTALAEGPLRKRHPFILPPCIEVQEFRDSADRARPTDRAVVTYVGSPGAKDDLASLLRAIALLSPPERAALTVNLAGIDEAQLRALPGVCASDVDESASEVICLGRLDRGQVHELLGTSHFTYLIRDPDAGYARYGFPSKVPESMAAGCPVVGNLTSDLGRYLHDDVNAILCQDAAPNHVASALRRALLSLTDGSYARISQDAQSTAAEHFDVSPWADPLATWLSASRARSQHRVARTG